jgi:hypothetical protein
MSTVGIFGFEGADTTSGLPQALLSLADDHGSNIVALFCLTGGGFAKLVFLDAVAEGAERLKAELRFDEGDWVGTLVGGGTGGAGDENPARPSSTNKSCETVLLVLEVEVDG